MRARDQLRILLLAAGLCGCAADLSAPPPMDCGQMRASFSMRATPKLDVLFMVDNSNGIELLAMELRDRFPRLAAGFERLAQAGVPLDAHFGVVTSDYGAGATGSLSCSRSPGGQRGRLQGIGVKALQNCKKPVGANFVRYVFDAGGAGPNNLPAAQTLTETIQCMASGGDGGCAFEHSLESVYAALMNDIPENAGFLRDDAVLAVFLITDEDDASAPADTDLFDVEKTPEYGYLDSYSRQTRFGVLCCPPGRVNCTSDELTFPPYDDSLGPLAGCIPAPNDPTGTGPGKLFDVRRYMQLKPDRNDIILMGVIGPTAPFQVMLSVPWSVFGQPTCDRIREDSIPACVPVLQHATCPSPRNPNFWPDPAVRLEAVIKSAPIHLIESACTSNFTNFLDSAAKLISNRFLAPACLPEKLKANAAVDCVVEESTTQKDGTTTVSSVPPCNGNPVKDVCYWLVKRDECAGRSPDSLEIAIERAGLAPERSVVEVVCPRGC